MLQQRKDNQIIAIPMKARPIHFLALGLALLFAGGSATASAGIVISNFNTDLDGWTLSDNDPASTLTYISTGGNPGGFIQFSDAAQGANDVFSAPAKFLGNDSTFLNGTLSFDLAHNEPAEDISTTPLVIMDTSGDNLSLILSAPATSNSPYTWTSYSFALNTTTGFIFDGGTNSSNGFILSGGTLATQVQINTVLNNVSSILLPADMHSGTELTGLDNFALSSSSVPEPSTWGLLAGGAAALFATLRRRVNQTA